MLLRRMFVLGCFVAFHSAYAEQISDFQTPRLGAVGVLATDRSHGTSMGMGLGLYSETFEFGITASGYVENVQDATQVASPVIYGG